MTADEAKGKAAVYWLELTPAQRRVLTPEWCEDCLAFGLDPLKEATATMQVAILNEQICELFAPLTKWLKSILGRPKR